MTTRTRGLGRGLGALLAPPPSKAQLPEGQLAPEQPSEGQTSGPRPDQAPVPVGQLCMLPVSRIVPNPRQPRRDFEEESLQQLAASIRLVGVLQPIVVRAIEDVPGAGYEVVMGERRWRAAQLADLREVPAIVRFTADDAMLRDALLENLHRDQLHALEEGAAYSQLLTDFGCTHEELAARVGKSRSQITNTIRLLNLPPTVQRRVAAGVISAGHARALLTFPSADQQEQVATRIVAEGLSVRAVEELATLAGPDGARRPRRSSRRPVPPGLDEVAGRLSERFETRVRVDMGRTKGRITVEFATFEDLERIVTAMAPAPPSWA